MQKTVKVRSNLIMWGALAGLLWLTGARAEAVVLRYDLKKGDIARYKEMSAQAMRMNFSVMGQENSMTIQQTSTTVYREQVIDVTPNGMIILVRTLESGKATAKMSGVEEEMNEEMPKTETTIKMTTRGKVLNALTSLPEGQSGEMMPGMSGMGLESFGADAGMMEAVFSRFPLPEGEVKPNDTWTDEIRIPGITGGPETTVTFKSRLLALEKFKGRDCAKIRTSVEMPLKMDMDDMMGGMMPPEVEAEMSMETSGKIVGRIEWQFDYKRGHPVYGEATGQVTFNSTFSMSEVEGQSISGHTNMVMKSNDKAWLIAESKAAE